MSNADVPADLFSGVAQSDEQAEEMADRVNQKRQWLRAVRKLQRVM